MSDKFSYDEKYDGVCSVIDKNNEEKSNEDFIDLLFRFFVSKGLIQIEEGILKIKTLKEVK